jgi:hypothetical protein
MGIADAKLVLIILIHPVRITLGLPNGKSQFFGLSPAFDIFGNSLISWDFAFVFDSYSPSLDKGYMVLFVYQLRLVGDDKCLRSGR